MTPLSTNNPVRLLALAAFVAGVSALLAANPAQSEEPESAEIDTGRADFEALRPYIGHWRTEAKSTAEGRSFRFLYHLVYFDAAETVARMEIWQRFEDGERRLLWNGYKGWNPLDEQTYYHGYNPQGRVSWGRFKRQGQDLVTVYEAFDAQGGHVYVRDVFTPVEDDQFDSTTYLRPADEQDWRIIGRDHWRRMEKVAR